MTTPYERAIAVCDRALGEEWDNPINLATFHNTFPPEVVREMLELLNEARFGEAVRIYKKHDALMRKIGGE